jgi:hypothetical protein
MDGTLTDNRTASIDYHLVFRMRVNLSFIALISSCNPSSATFSTAGGEWKLSSKHVKTPPSLSQPTWTEISTCLLATSTLALWVHQLIVNNVITFVRSLQ